MTGKKATTLKLAERGYRQQVIDILEQALSGAKGGKVIECILYTRNSDGESFIEYSGTDNIPDIIFTLDRMKRSMHRRLDETVEDEP